MQLQQSGAIPDAQQVTNYNSERPRQTESSTIIIDHKNQYLIHNHLLYNTLDNQ